MAGAQAARGPVMSVRTFRLTRSGERHMQNIVEFHIIGRLGRIDAAKNVTHISVATNYNRREGDDMEVRSALAPRHPVRQIARPARQSRHRRSCPHHRAHRPVELPSRGPDPLHGRFDRRRLRDPCQSQRQDHRTKSTTNASGGGLYRARLVPRPCRVCVVRADPLDWNEPLGEVKWTMPIPKK